MELVITGLSRIHGGQPGENVDISGRKLASQKANTIASSFPSQSLLKPNFCVLSYELSITIIVGEI